MILTKLTKKDIKSVREKWVKDQCNICPIFKKKYSKEDFVLDHNHKTGYCRGAIHRNANQFEGKVRSAFIRFGCLKEIDLISALRNLANYLEDNHSDEHIVYPNKTKKTKKIVKNINPR